MIEPVLPINSHLTARIPDDPHRIAKQTQSTNEEAISILVAMTIAPQRRPFAQFYGRWTPFSFLHGTQERMLYAFFAPCPLNVFIGVSSISVWDDAISCKP